MGIFDFSRVVDYIAFFNIQKPPGYEGSRFLFGGMGLIMSGCKNHPEREGQYYCSKHQYYLCQECVQCLDPTLYCKYRSACLISFIGKEKKASNKIT